MDRIVFCFLVLFCFYVGINMESSEYIFLALEATWKTILAMALENELALVLRETWGAKTALVLETALLSVREQHLIGLG